MKTAFRSSFTRDLKKLKDRSVLEQVRLTIERIEDADDLKAIGGVSKMSGSEDLNIGASLPSVAVTLGCRLAATQTLDLRPSRHSRWQREPMINDGFRLREKWGSVYQLRR